MQVAVFLLFQFDLQGRNVLMDLQKLLPGGNTQLAVYVPVVVFQGVFRDVQLRQHLLGGGSCDISFVNLVFRGGQPFQTCQKKLHSVRADGLGRSVRDSFRVRKGQS